MHAVIVGAGVGGLAFAGGLHRRGHSVTVVEQAPDLPSAGAALSVWFNGAAALVRLGHALEPDTPGGGRRIDRLLQRRSDGRLIFDADVVRLQQRFTVPALTIPRRALLERLATDLPAGTIRGGVRCAAVYDSDAGATVVMADGTQVSGDLVVGADGHRSVVRTALVGSGAARPTGWTAWQGLSHVPIPLTDGHTSVSYVGKEGYCGLMPAGDGLLQWWFDVRTRQANGRPPEAGSVHGRLRSSFGRWPAPVPAVLDHVYDEPFETWRYVRHVVPTTWGRGRIVILGDAVHAMPPSLAQGGNQTLEDAWILCRELCATPDDPASAAARYHQIRRRKVAATSWLSARAPVQDIRLPWLRFHLPQRATSSMFAAFLRSVSNTL